MPKQLDTQMGRRDSVLLRVKLTPDALETVMQEVHLPSTGFTKSLKNLRHY